MQKYVDSKKHKWRVRMENAEQLQVKEKAVGFSTKWLCDFRKKVILHKWNTVAALQTQVWLSADV